MRFTAARYDAAIEALVAAKEQESRSEKRLASELARVVRYPCLGHHGLPCEAERSETGADLPRVSSQVVAASRGRHASCLSPVIMTVTLFDFLTEAQIDEALRLYEIHGGDAAAEIQAQVIEPNMATINAKLGQENDALYLAHMVVHVFTRVRRATGAS